MELYDSKYVYFEWDKELDGKKGFVAKNIQSLKDQVNRRLDTMVTITDSGEDVNPFTYFIDDGFTSDYAFAYYDPYYEFRKAYLEGKQLQFKDYVGSWRDVVGEPIFTRNEYRIKPKMWYIVLDEHGLSRINSKIDGDVLFEGTEDECIKWMKKYEKFEDIMLAWKQNKTIQYKDDGKWIDWIVGIIPSKAAFDRWTEWRIKKDDVIESVPFDSVQELIDAWEKKSGVKFNPELSMPFIWIRSKYKNYVYLITDFLFDKKYKCDVGTEEENLKLKELFDDYTFLNGSIIGKVKGEGAE